MKTDYFERRRFLHICEVCDRTELLTPDEAFRGGWDYPPHMGAFGGVSPRTCPDCSILDTVWTAIELRKAPIEQLTPKQTASLLRILREPMNLIPEDEKMERNERKSCMGNRAVITTQENFDNNGIGVYIHWNGGRDSVEAFLEYCRLRRFRPPDEDCMGWARLVQVIANYFRGGLSVGVGTVNRLDTDNGHNGTYIIRGWKIVGREYFTKREQNNHDLDDMLMELDLAQPEQDRLGPKYLLHSEDKPAREIRIGDEVWLPLFSEDTLQKETVAGFGRPDDDSPDGPWNHDLPYVDLIQWKHYLTEPVYRVVKKKNTDQEKE